MSFNFNKYRLVFLVIVGALTGYANAVNATGALNTCACPAGSTILDASNFTANLVANTDYCIDADLNASGAFLMFGANSSLTVASGAYFHFTGSFHQVATVANS